MPDGEVAAAAGALLGGTDGRGRFGRYRQETGHARDILVCTPGGRDVCCGKFGYPVYDLLRRMHAAPGN